MALDSALMALVNLELYSEAEQRIPFGAHQRFFSQLIREYFERGVLDLAPFAGCEPGAFVIRGSKVAVRMLERTLKGELPQ